MFEYYFSVVPHLLSSTTKRRVVDPDLNPFSTLKRHGGEGRTFLFPYLLVRMKYLNTFDSYNFIRIEMSYDAPYTILCLRVTLCRLVSSHDEAVDSTSYRLTSLAP